MVMLNRRIDIKSNITPTNKVPIDMSVKGIEKYLVVLKVERTIIENKMPRPIKIVPGIPRNFRGCFNAMCSIRDEITSPECDTGFFVDVLPPVS